MTFDTYERSRYRGAPVALHLVVGSDTETPVGPFAFNNGETDIVREGIIFRPWPIKHGDITSDGTLDKSDLTVSLALGTDLDSLFLSYPPSQVVNLIIFEGHMDDDVTPETFPAVWSGRIVNGEHKENELHLSCLPVSTAIKRPGLRRNYQIGCPHVLYGEQCRANKAAATVTRTIISVSRNEITFDATLGEDRARYAGGLVEWVAAGTGYREVRTIASIAPLGNRITFRGMPRGLAPGMQISLTRGCNHLMSGCEQHGNIHNYGGQPFIPLENPLSQKNQFY